MKNFTFLPLFKPAIISSCIGLISVFIISACSRTGIKNATDAENDLLQKLPKDSLVIAFKKLDIEFTEEVAADKFDLSHSNKKMIEENMRKCKTFNQFLALYDSAGIKNAREYINLTWGKMDLAALIARKYHSELSMLPRSEENKVISRTLYPAIPADTIANLTLKHYHPSK